MKYLFSKVLKVTAGFVSLFTSATWQSAFAEQNDVEWLGQAANLSYQVDLEADAQNCELYVEDFSEVLQSYRGSRSSGIRVTLQTRAGDKIANVGAVAVAEEESVEGLGSEREKLIKGKRTIGIVDDFLAAYPEHFAGRATVNLDQEWNSFGQHFGTREIKQIAFFVDLRDGSTIKRLWLKNGSQDFTKDDFSREKFNYSYPLSYGYGSIRYLWKDSGSPLFNARSFCSGR